MTVPHLATPAAVRRLIEAYGFHLKKSLGQHFLVDRRILEKIIAAAQIQAGDTVLEIGPGVGTVTQALAEAGAQVVAVEIDAQLVPVLQNTLAAYPSVKIITGDALRLPLRSLLPPGPCRVVANLPYYITTPLLMKLYEEELPLTITVVMVQREVAARIMAAPGSKEYGAFTVDLHYHAEAEIVAQAPRSVFFPPPEVDSTVVRLTTRPFPYPAADPPVFKAVVRAAFGQRRKTLRKALQRLLTDADAALAACGLDGSRRGETLTPAEFGRLSLTAVPFLRPEALP